MAEETKNEEVNWVLFYNRTDPEIEKCLENCRDDRGNSITSISHDEIADIAGFSHGVTWRPKLPQLQGRRYYTVKADLCIPGRPDRVECEYLVGFPHPFDPGEKYPLIVYNRGGNRDYGRLDNDQIFWIDAIFGGEGVIVASQYPYPDEYGGPSDIHSVLNGARMFQQQPWINPKQTIMDGASRGGSETLIAAKIAAEYDVQLAAISVHAPAVRMDLSAQNLPIAIGKNIHAQTIVPGVIGQLQKKLRREPFPEEIKKGLERAYYERSAGLWEDAYAQGGSLNQLPVLVSASGFDPWIPLEHIESWVKLMRKHQAPYHFSLYPGCGHFLESYSRVLDELEIVFGSGDEKEKNLKRIQQDNKKILHDQSAEGEFLRRHIPQTLPLEGGEIDPKKARAIMVSERRAWARMQLNPDDREAKDVFHKKVSKVSPKLVHDGCVYSELERATRSLIELT